MCETEFVEHYNIKYCIICLIWQAIVEETSIRTSSISFWICLMTQNKMYLICARCMWNISLCSWNRNLEDTDIFLNIYSENAMKTATF